MTWTLSELASVAEILGLLAIVPSLIFVGVQLVRGNREARATTTQLAVQSEMDIATALLDNASIWEKVVTGAPLAAGEETRKAIILFNLLMLETASRYQQFKSGYLEPESWEGRARILPSLVEAPIYDVWRNSHGGMNLPASFLKLLESLKSGA